MKNKGFTLIEVLVALIILSLIYMALLKLHTHALSTFSYARDIFNCTLKLDAFLNGENTKGINSKSYTFQIESFTINQKEYTTTCGKAAIFFKIYEEK